MALVAVVLVAVPPQAQADVPAPIDPLFPFEPAVCLESQVAAQWRIHTPPETEPDGVDWPDDKSTFNINDLAYTAENTEIKVAAPGVLKNDTIQDFGVRYDVTEWNAAHGPTQQVIASLVRLPDHASAFTLRPDGSFEWRPAPGYFGPDSFDYVAEWNGVCSEPKTVSITGTFRMFAVDDEFFQFGDGILDATLFGVLDNDQNKTEKVPTVASVSFDRLGVTETTTTLSPIRLEHGVLRMLGVGTFTFEPDPGFRGIQQFSYTPKLAGPPDSAGGPRKGKVSLFVVDAPPGAQPRGVNDELSTPEDTAIEISPSTLMANDQAAAFITFIGTNLFQADEFRTWHGTVTPHWTFFAGLYKHLAGFTYTPDPDFHGVDFVDYWVASRLPPDTGPVAGRVYFQVAAVAEAPVANMDSADTLQDQPVTIDLLANDTDDERFDLPSSIEPFSTTHCSSAMCNGTWELSGDGTVTYTPTPGFVGTAAWDYSLFDSEGLTSASFASVNVMRNDAVDDQYDATEDTVLDVAAPGVHGNDPNASVANAVPELVSGPAHGELVFRADGGFRYTPAANFTGPDSFTYAYRNPLTGALGDLGTANVDVAPVNDAPFVELNGGCQKNTDCLLGELRDVDEGGTVTMNGFLTDREHNQGELTVQWGDGQSTTATYPCEGADCPFTTAPTYSPPPLCVNPPTGPATCPVKLFFRFTHKYADDPAGASDRYDVTVTADDGEEGSQSTSAWARNVAPQINLLSAASVAATEGQPVHVSAKVTDPGDSAPMMVDWGDGSAPQQADIACSAGFTDCRFVAQHTYVKRSAPYTATLSADDGDGGADTETVTVSFDQPPVADAVNEQVAEDDVLIVAAPGLLASASDPDGDTVSLVSNTEPEHGDLEVSADGGWTYTPDADYHGPDAFTYTVAAGGQEDTGTVSITVGSVNDPPTAADVGAATAEDTPVTVTPDVADVDGDTLNLAVGTAPDSGSVTVTAEGLKYEPDADFHGTDSFTYTASDGAATSAPGTVTVTVTGVNDPPTAANVSLTTNEDTPVTTPADVDDVDGDELTLSVVQGPAHGSVSIVAGDLRYTPAADYSGADSFTYLASDGTAQSGTATVSVTVTEVADAPVVTPVNDLTGVYSDAISQVTITATDEDSAADALTFNATGLPAGLSLTDAGDGSANLAGTLTASPGAYPVTVTVCDEDDECDTGEFTVNVVGETAIVRLAPNNPYAVAVGGSGAPSTTVTARITDAADGSYGDLTRINAAAVRIAVTPVDGGSAVTCPVSITRRVAATATTPGFAEVSCTFAAGLKLDVYELTASVSGPFTGSDTSLLSVYDPQARGASGAGTVQLDNGNIAQFAFSAAADGKTVKGKMLLLERNPSGAVVNVVKGVNLSTLVIGSGAPKSVKATGKAVVNGIGNYAFVLTGTDLGTASSTPTAADTFGLKVTAPRGAPALSSLSFNARAVATGGNINIR